MTTNSGCGVSPLRIVGFLQNAWSPLYAGGTWPRQSWLKALERSRSGQRLRIITEGLKGVADFWFDNTTPLVGATPDSKLKPDLNHIFSVLDAQHPDYIIGFGKQAKDSLNKILRPAKTIFVPHPANRTLKNELYEDLVRILSDGLFDQEDDFLEIMQYHDNAFTYEYGKYVSGQGYVVMSR